MHDCTHHECALMNSSGCKLHACNSPPKTQGTTLVEASELNIDIAIEA